jgi:hypothetical protein
MQKSCVERRTRLGNKKLVDHFVSPFFSYRWDDRGL